MLLKKFRMLKFRTQALREMVAATATAALNDSVLFYFRYVHREAQLPIAARFVPKRSFHERSIWLQFPFPSVSHRLCPAGFFFLSSARRTHH